MPAQTTITCDVKGCTQELQNGGGAVIFHSLSARRTFYFCEQHWKQLGETFMPILGEINGEDKTDLTDHLDSSDSSSRSSREATPAHESGHENVVPFPQKETPTTS